MRTVSRSEVTAWMATLEPRELWLFGKCLEEETLFIASVYQSSSYMSPYWSMLGK